MKQRQVLHSCSLLLCLLFFGPAVYSAPATTAAEIVDRAAQIYEGIDSQSELNFLIHSANGKDKRLTFVMLWKKYQQGAIEDKTILFQTFPPSRKGITFMNWSYREDERRDDDAWLYLPELRSVRKVVHGHHQHHKKMPGDFASSLLRHNQLLARPAKLDHLRRLKDQHRNGTVLQVIERRPKTMDMGYPYSRVIESYETKHGHLTHQDYFDAQDKHVLSLDIDWQIIGKAHVWRHVRAQDPRNGQRTELKIMHIRIDQQLPERSFSKRRMRLGPP